MEEDSFPQLPEGSEISFEIRQLLVLGEAGPVESLVCPAGEPRLDCDPRKRKGKLLYAQCGEKLRLAFKVQPFQALSEWVFQVRLINNKEWKSSILEIRPPRPWTPAGAFLVEFQFEAHLAPGEYLLGCVVQARRAGGEIVQFEQEHVARCLVVGPQEAVGDSLVKLESVVEVGLLKPAQTEANGERSNPNWGKRARLLGFEVKGLSNKPIVSGQPTEAVLRAHFVDPTERPSFKLGWATPNGETVSRLLHAPEKHPLSPALAGDSWEYRALLTPYLNPGVYQVNAALQSSLPVPEILDGRVGAARCRVACVGYPQGRALLEGTILIDPEGGAIDS